MFDLFLALFGGAYYAARIGAEKSEHKRISRESDIRIKNMNSDFDRWVLTMSDEKLEYDLKNELQNNPTSLFETIKSEINALEIFKPVDDYFGFMSQCNEKWEKLVPMRMLMAKNIKLLKDDAWTSYTSPGIWDYAEKLKWQRHHKFMMWLDKELQSHGVEQMYFVDNTKKYEARNGGGEVLSNIFQPIYGIYFWKSARLSVI